MPAPSTSTSAWVAEERRDAAQRQQNLRAESTKVNYERVCGDYKAWCDSMYHNIDTTQRYIVNENTFYLFMTALTKDYWVTKQHDMICKKIDELKESSRKTQPSKNCYKIVGILQGDEEDESDDDDDDDEDVLSMADLTAYSELDKHGRKYKLGSFASRMPLNVLREKNYVAVVKQKKFVPETDREAIRAAVERNPTILYYEKVVGKKSYFGTKPMLKAYFAQNHPIHAISYKNFESFSNGVKSLFVKQHPGSPVSKLNTGDMYNLTKEVQQNESKRYKNSGIDSQIGSVKDGYLSLHDLQRTAQYFIGENCNDPRKGSIGIKWLVAFLFCFFCLLRGQMFRGLNLSDMFLLKMDLARGIPSTGTACFALCLLIRESKKNTTNKPEVFSCLRNSNVFICPHGALALYFFVLFHFLKKSFPDLKDFKSWARKKVIPGEGKNKNEEAEVSYSSHAKAMRTAFAFLKIVTSKLTHIGRKAGAQMALALGAAVSAIKLAGGWEEGSCERAYLQGISNEVNMALAGFADKIYYLRRAQVKVKDDLKRKIFPELNQYTDMAPEDFAKLTLSAQSFIELLDYLREVFIQDSPKLMAQYPGHFIFAHPIFKSKEYDEFLDDYGEVMEQPDPSEVNLTNALPELMDYLKKWREETKVESRQREKDARDRHEKSHIFHKDSRTFLKEKLVEFARSQKRTMDCLAEVFIECSQIDSAVEDECSQARQQGISARINAAKKLHDETEKERDDLISLLSKNSNESELLASVPQPPAHPNAPNTAHPQRSQARQNIDQIRDRASKRPNEFHSESVDAQGHVTKKTKTFIGVNFPMSSALKTVQDVWKEYKNGSDGNDPIEQLEKAFAVDRNARYWNGNAEALVRKRRLAVVKLVSHIAEKYEILETQAATFISTWCKKKEKSLSWLGKALHDGKSKEEDGKGKAFFLGPDKFGKELQSTNLLTQTQLKRFQDDKRKEAEEDKGRKEAERREQASLDEFRKETERQREASKDERQNSLNTLIDLMNEDCSTDDE